ncbi:E3 ubiquitin-protein ligase RNF8-like protein, partial [Dinothrombium tinctorium]
MEEQRKRNNIDTDTEEVNVKREHNAKVEHVDFKEPEVIEIILDDEQKLDSKLDVEVKFQKRNSFEVLKPKDELELVKEKHNQEKDKAQKIVEHNEAAAPATVTSKSVANNAECVKVATINGALFEESIQSSEDPKVVKSSSSNQKSKKKSTSNATLNQGEYMKQRLELSETSKTDEVEKRRKEEKNLRLEKEKLLKNVKENITKDKTDENKALKDGNGNQLANEGASCSGQKVERKYEDKFESELTCSICYELFIQPFNLNCSHTFCLYCIERWKKDRNSHRECPVCRELITSTTRQLVIENRIDKIINEMDEEEKLKRSQVVEERKKLLEQMPSTSADNHSDEESEHESDEEPEYEGDLDFDSRSNANSHNSDDDNKYLTDEYGFSDDDSDDDFDDVNDVLDNEENMDEGSVLGQDEALNSNETNNYESDSYETAHSGSSSNSHTSDDDNKYLTDEYGFSMDYYDYDFDYVNDVLDNEENMDEG